MQYSFNLSLRAFRCIELTKPRSVQSIDFKSNANYTLFSIRQFTTSKQLPHTTNTFNRKFIKKNIFYSTKKETSKEETVAQRFMNPKPALIEGFHYGGDDFVYDWKFYVGLIGFGMIIGGSIFYFTSQENKATRPFRLAMATLSADENVEKALGNELKVFTLRGTSIKLLFCIKY
jgi:hypothetical protein